MDARRLRLAYRGIASPCKCFPTAVEHGRVSLLPGGPLSSGSLIIFTVAWIAPPAKQSNRNIVSPYSKIGDIRRFPPSWNVSLQVSSVRFSRFTAIMSFAWCSLMKPLYFKKEAYDFFHDMRRLSWTDIHQSSCPVSSSPVCSCHFLLYTSMCQLEWHISNFQKFFSITSSDALLWLFANGIPNVGERMWTLFFFPGALLSR